MRCAPQRCLRLQPGTARVPPSTHAHAARAPTRQCDPLRHAQPAHRAPSPRTHLPARDVSLSRCRRSSKPSAGAPDSAIPSPQRTRPKHQRTRGTPYDHTATAKPATSTPSELPRRKTSARAPTATPWRTARRSNPSHHSATSCPLSGARLRGASGARRAAPSARAAALQLSAESVQRRRRLRTHATDCEPPRTPVFRSPPAPSPSSRHRRRGRHAAAAATRASCEAKRFAPSLAPQLTRTRTQRCAKRRKDGALARHSETALTREAAPDGSSPLGQPGVPAATPIALRRRTNPKNAAGALRQHRDSRARQRRSAQSAASACAAHAQRARSPALQRGAPTHQPPLPYAPLPPNASVLRLARCCCSGARTTASALRSTTAVGRALQDGGRAVRRAPLRRFNPLPHCRGAPS